MSIVPFKQAKFIKSAVKSKDYPDLYTEDGKVMIEVAVAGRSNVGKSSLLNDLFGTRRLVKTSSTPGKTQIINFFTLDEQIGFVDLPGYGYAKVPLTVRKQWGPMVEAYFKNRPSLKLLLLLFDIRRVPNQDDLHMVEWAHYFDLPLILVFTKVDKVKQNEKAANTKKILKAFNVDNLHYVHYSVTKKIGRENLIKKISDELEGYDTA